MQLVFVEIFGFFRYDQNYPRKNRKRPKKDKDCKIFQILTFLCNVCEIFDRILRIQCKNELQGKSLLSWGSFEEKEQFLNRKMFQIDHEKAYISVFF